MMNAGSAPSRVVLSGLIALAALVASTPATAQRAGNQFVSTAVTESGTGIGRSSSDSLYDVLGSTSSTGTWTRADGGGSGIVSAGMTIGPGMIHADLSLSYQGQIDSTVMANGSMFDGLRFTAQGQQTNDTPLHVVYSVLVDERRTAENTTGGGFFGPASFGTRGIGEFGEQGLARQLQVVQDGPYTRMVYEATVSNDQWYYLSWGLLATAYSYNSWPPQQTDHGSTSLDLTFYWGGIQSVTDSKGNLLNYAVTADSGYDFRNSFAPAVPEPSSMALLAAGGMMLVVIRRRRGGRDGFAATSAFIP